MKLSNANLDSRLRGNDKFGLYSFKDHIEIKYSVKSRKKQNISASRGFTLIETLVAVFLLMTLILGMYEGFSATLKIIRASRQKTDAMLLANELLETMKNMPYDEVGITGSGANYKVDRDRTFVRGGITFNVTTTVRPVDDPLDGTMGGVPNDTAPSDYKLTELDINCPNCQNFPTYHVTTTVAPKNLENMSGNGAIFVRVFDANGSPIQGVTIQTVNGSVFSNTDTTDNDGMLKIMDVPPGALSYQVTASKTGYSTSKTYLPAGEAGANPASPNGTVLASQITPMSFAIDRTSTVNIRSITSDCSPVPDVGFHLTGTKKIGSDPDVYKYSKDLSTGGGGTLQLNNMEWDTYNLSTSNSGSYLLAGSLPLSPVSVVPGSTQSISLIMGERNPNNVLVIVKDASTGLPLSDSSVTITAGASPITITTDRGYFSQTDWSNGPGQTDWSDKKRFDSSDGNIDYSTLPGDIKLRSTLGQYLTAGNLTSSIFDAGSASSTFFSLAWDPGDQPAIIGANSVRFQLASSPTNTAETEWRFVGPDGSASSYYTSSNSAIWSGHNNERYIRYRIFLATAEASQSPNISNVSITYSSDCIPFGQAFFGGLPGGNYVLEITHNGYKNFMGMVNTTNTAYQVVEAEMNQ